jgi:hypothetical protein
LSIEEGAVSEEQPSNEYDPYDPFRAWPNEYVVPFTLEVIKGFLWIYPGTMMAKLEVAVDREGYALWHIKMRLSDNDDPEVVGHIHLQAVRNNRTHIKVVCYYIGDGTEMDVIIERAVESEPVYFIHSLRIEQARIDLIPDVPAIEDPDYAFVNEEFKKAKEGKAKRRMRTDAERGIKALAELREKALSAGKQIPGWSDALLEAGTTLQTVEKYAPKLKAGWPNKTYHWSDDDLEFPEFP